MTWNQEKDKEAGFNFTTRQHALIVKELEALDSSEKLQPPHVELYRRFVIPDQD